MDLGKDSIKKLLIKYLIPAMCSTLVTSFYYVADTVMIGHGVGDEGLIALNIILPVFSLLYGIGYLCGIGGSVLMSVAKGKNDETQANRIFSSSLILICVAGVFLTILLYGFRYEVCYFLGADEENIELVMEYGKYLFGFAWVFCMFPFLLTFVRNDKNPKLAMAGSMAGSLTNVFFDYILIFVLDFGLAGAIIATVLGGVLNILLTCTHFLTKRNTMHFSFRFFSLREVLPVFGTGATSFFNELSSGFVILIFNWQILKYIGETGIVVYSTISNTILVIIAMCNGIGTAMQPIISYNYGARLPDRIKSCKRMALRISVCINTLLYIVIFVFAKELIYLYVKPTEAVLTMGVSAIQVYFLAVFPMLVNIFYATYFQAVVKGAWSFWISVMRGFVCSIGLVMLLPYMFGGSAIWFATPLAEFLTMCLALYLARREGNF